MDWSQLREQMPVTRRWAFFDHAAVAPLSGPAQQALIAWTNDLAENGDVHEPQWVQRVEDIRALVARLIHADPLDIAFIKNTSEGIGIVAEGFPWQPGDNIITAEEEYPANIYPWMNLASRGVEVRRIASRDRRLWIDDIRAAIDRRTRIVSLSYVEFATGFRNDLGAVGELCRQHGIWFMVDAIQGLGILPLDVQAMPIDALAADGHKWLLGPEGAGVFYLRRELVDRLHPVGIGWNSVVNCKNFSQIDFTLKPHAGRWESGSLNMGGTIALGASLELLLPIGVPALADRIRFITDHLCDRARQIGLEVYSSRAGSDWSGIVSLIRPGPDARATVRQCRQEGIVINQRAGRLRVSPHAYNTTEEIDRLTDALRPARTLA